MQAIRLAILQSRILGGPPYTSYRVWWSTQKEKKGIVTMTTVETTPALRTRLIVDLEDKRSYLQVTGEGLNHNERRELMHSVCEQLSLNSQELDAKFSLSDANLIVLESADGLTYETWQQVATVIGSRLGTHVSVITEEDIFAFARVQTVATVGKVLTAVTNILVQHAVGMPPVNQW